MSKHNRLISTAALFCVSYTIFFASELDFEEFFRILTKYVGKWFWVGISIYDFIHRPPTHSERDDDAHAGDHKIKRIWALASIILTPRKVIKTTKFPAITWIAFFSCILFCWCAACLNKILCSFDFPKIVQNNEQNWTNKMSPLTTCCMELMKLDKNKHKTEQKKTVEKKQRTKYIDTDRVNSVKLLTDKK